MPTSAVHRDTNTTLLSVTAFPGETPTQVVVEVVGEVDTATAPLLELCLDSQADQAAVREIVVDLRRVSFLGAAGVAVLVRAQQRSEARGARLVVLTGGRTSALRALQLTGTAQRLGVELPSRAGRGGTARPRRRGPGLPGRCAGDRRGTEANPVGPCPGGPRGHLRRHGRLTARADGSAADGYVDGVPAGSCPARWRLRR